MTGLISFTLHVKDETGAYIVGPCGANVPLEDDDDLFEMIAKHAAELSRIAKEYGTA